MYQFKIENTVEKIRKVTVEVGEQLVDENGVGEVQQVYEVVEIESVDENGNPVTVLTNQLAVDVNGNPITEPKLNDTGSVSIIPVNKTAQEIADEEQVLIDAKTADIQGKLETYMAAQQYQMQNGGPGPVADFEIMKICNEHNCQFEVVFKEEEE